MHAHTSELQNRRANHVYSNNPDPGRPGGCYGGEINTPNLDKAWYYTDAITPMEGRSLVPTVSGRAIDRETIHFEHEGMRSLGNSRPGDPRTL